MPMFMKTNASQRREKLILGGALTHRFGKTKIPFRNFRAKMQLTRKATAASRPRSSPTGGVQKRRSKGQSAPSQRLKAGHSAARRRPRGTKKSLLSGKRSMVPTNRRAAKKPGVIHHKNSFRSMLGKLTANAKNTMNQLAKSRQVKRALKSIGRDAIAATAGMSHAVSKRLLTGKSAAMPLATKKRPFNALLDESADDDEDGNANEPALKRVRFGPNASSSIGYRGKSIQRGGTKQKGTSRFLF